MRIRIHIVIPAIIALVAISHTASAFKTQQLTEWYTDYAWVSEGASITTPSKLKGNNEPENILGGKNWSQGQEYPGCIFEDNIQQREEFTIDLGQTRKLGLLVWQSLYLPRRMPETFTIQISNKSAKGPWKTILKKDSPNAYHTIGLDGVYARWIHVDMGINEGLGTALYHFKVCPRYRLMPAGVLMKDFSKHLRRDAPELKLFWKAADKNQWDTACDELIKIYAARGHDTRAELSKPNFQVDPRVIPLMENRIEDGGYIYQFDSSDWDWNAVRAGAPGTNLGWLPGAYSIFNGFTNAYLGTGDVKYGRKLADLLTDWLQDNPCPGWHADYDGNLIEAWIGLRAAGRCGVFSKMAFALCADEKVFTRDLKINLIYSIWQHLELLDAIRPELGGNWLTNVNSSLFGVGIKCPEFVEQKRWLADSMESFEDSLKYDVFPSGREVEDSTMYVPIASNQMAHQYTAIRKADITLSPDAEKKMSLLYDPIAWALYPDGSGPTVGDCGRRSPQPKGNKFVPDVYMALYDRPDFKYMNSKGKEGIPPKETARSFHGWYVMRTAWEEKPFEDARYMFFKDSPQGPKLNRAHSHSDQLSFTLYAYGQELLTDPGMSSYGLPSNKYFSGTAYHNTICINGEDQDGNRSGDEHAWYPGWGADFVDGSFQSYTTAIHRRQILFLKSGAGLPDYWFVHDYVRGRAVEHTLDANFHFSEDASPMISGKSVHTSFPSGGNLLIYGAPDSPTPSLGDYSIWDNKLGECPGKFAQYQIKAVIPAKLDTFFVPYKGDKSPAFSAVELIPDQPDTAKEMSAFSVETAAGTDVVFACTEPSQKRSFGGGSLVSDAQALILRYNKSGALIYAFQYGGTSTTYKDKEVVKVEQGKTSVEWK